MRGGPCARGGGPAIPPMSRRSTTSQDDLRGWRGNRWVFVGDSGMFSAANRQRLGRALGRYILAVPMRKVTEVHRRSSPAPAATATSPTTCG